jgi:hypothetical protein
LRSSTTRKRGIVEGALNMVTGSAGGLLWVTYTSTELKELMIALTKRRPSNTKSFQHLLRRR